MSSGLPSRGLISAKRLNPASDDFVDDAMGQAEGIIEVNALSLIGRSRFRTSLPPSPCMCAS